MSSIEPRLNQSPGGNGNGTGTGTVKVAKGVESALALVQQQLTRQAETVQVAPAPVAPLPLPVAPRAPVAPPPPPPPPTVVPTPVPAEEPPRSRARIRPSPEEDEEFWDEPRPRRERLLLDPKSLTRAESRALGRLKARKVRRIVRHVSPWSVFKVSILFYLCLWLILMVAGVILWRVGQDAGVVTNIEKFYAKAAGEKVFEINGRGVFRAASAAGAILVFAATAFTVLMSILFNLITDLTGGVRLSVLELESTKRDLRGVGGDRLAARVRRDSAASQDLEDGHQTEDPDDPELSAIDPSVGPQKVSEPRTVRSDSDKGGADSGSAEVVEPRTRGLAKRRVDPNTDEEALVELRPTAATAPD